MPAPDDRNSFLASLPAGVRAALEAQDVQALDLAQAQASGNTDVVYEALARLPPDEADRLYAQLQEQGLL